MAPYVFVSLVCIIFTFFCGYWALETNRHASNEDPSSEFLIRQLTAGTWFFGVLAVLVVLYGAAMVQFFGSAVELAL